MVIINSTPPPKGNISKRNQRKERQSRAFFMKVSTALEHRQGDKQSIPNSLFNRGGVNVYYVKNHTIENNDQ